MQICTFGDYRLMLLLPWHADAVRGMQPGDLAASQGEWICPRGKEDHFIKRGLLDLADGKGFWSGIWSDASLCGLVALHHIDTATMTASLSYALDARYRG